MLNVTFPAVRVNASMAMSNAGDCELEFEDRLIMRGATETQHEDDWYD